MKVNIAIDNDIGLKSFPHRRKMRMNQKLRKKECEYDALSRGELIAFTSA
jgi:hypothetical protein